VRTRRLAASDDAPLRGADRHTVTGLRDKSVEVHHRVDRLEPPVLPGGPGLVEDGVGDLADRVVGELRVDSAGRVLLDVAGVGSELGHPSGRTDLLDRGSEPSSVSVPSVRNASSRNNDSMGEPTPPATFTNSSGARPGRPRPQDKAGNRSECAPGANGGSQ
jgi:hypothetical protein